MANLFHWFKTSKAAALDGNFGLELVRQMVIPTFVLGPDGNVLVWNDACEALTGLKAAAVVGTKEHWRGFYAAPRPCLADLVFTSGNGVSAAYANVQIDVKTGRGRAENWCELPRGGRRYLAIDAGIVRNAQGQLLAVVETLRDMTGEQEALARVSASQAESKRQAEDEQRKAVRELAEGLYALAEGNLDVEISAAFPESYGQLRTDFNRAMQELSADISRIRGASGNVARSADEIANGSSALAQRAEHQAAMLEETSAAHHQITATVNKTLVVSREAVTVVTNAKDSATRSREVVDQTVVAIQSIEESSRQITQIISVIDEIAFQTNLLALNAGVEAARAGDAGRGFAVVAQEVRALAQRSTEAAREIKGLIGASATAVAHGVKLVNQTGASLHTIVDQVADAASRFQDIATAAQDQATALAEVNQALGELDKVTQQNAGVAERNAGACSKLTAEAVQLASLVDKFNVRAEDERRWEGAVGSGLSRVA
ncbi:MAG: methyl-accepting chemotaxis protein [Hyphomicrobiales bacterium]|nr:methyl-accepting chemotaxis protein [Hyphomicrobiales bacterium]